MKILPYKIGATNELLTSRMGLLAIVELMNRLGLANHIDATFPQPGSNRGFKPSVFVETLILMQHAGGFHLDDVRDIKMDTALRTLFELKQVPQAGSLGNCLRRMGKNPQVMKALNTVNKVVLDATLHKRKAVTLDIDATEIIAAKAEARWTYKHHRGYMPIVGHIQGCSILGFLSQVGGFYNKVWIYLLMKGNAMLTELLLKVKDCRRKQGRRYQLNDILLFSIFAVMSGAESYRKIHAFIKEHYSTLRRVF